MRLRRRSVDFVGKQDAREDGAFDETEVPATLVVFFQNVRARDVRRHQVRGELDPFERDVQNLGQRTDHEGFGQPGHAYEQAVASGKDGGEDLLDHFVLADDDLLQFLLHQPAVLAELLQNVSQAARLGRGCCAWGDGSQRKTLILSCTTSPKDRETFHKVKRPTGADQAESIGSSNWLAALPPCVYLHIVPHGRASAQEIGD